MPAVIDDAAAIRWFTSLHDRLDRQTKRRLMVERELDVAVRRADFCTNSDLSESSFDALSLMATRVEAPFNSISLAFCINKMLQAAAILS